MTTLEILLLSAAGWALVARSWSSSSGPRSLSASSLLSAPVLLLHLVVDGPRWQLIPTYLFVAVLLLGVLSFPRHRFQGDEASPGPLPWGRRVVGFCLCALWLLGSCLLPLALPRFELPTPSGPFPVGTRTLLLTDSTRQESFLPSGEARREIPARAWYPASEGCRGKTRAYWQPAGRMSAAWAAYNGMRWAPFIWSHLGRVRTHSCEDAPVSEIQGGHPVLVFSHGYRQPLSFNTTLMEELASQGYVVLGITHPFEVPFAVYPDGRVRMFNRDNPELQRRVSEEMDPSRWSILGEIYAAESWEVQKPLYEAWYEGIPAWWESNTIWLEDILFSISALPRLNDAAFRGGLDLERLGVFGYSFGGGASALATMTDSRVRAGMNIDGFQYGHTLGRSLAAPFMFVTSEGHQGANDFFMDRAEDTAYEISVSGTRHSNFTDAPLLAPIPLRLTGRLGPIDGRRGREILAAYVVAFFDQHLKGIHSELLQGPSAEFPEVTLRTWHPSM